MTLQETVILKILPDVFDVVKLTPPQAFPAWLANASTFFVAQTSDEYSIMCPQDCVPQDVRSGTDWFCIRVDGDLETDQVGVAAGVSKPLADAGLSIILVGTHDRDYVLVESELLTRAIEVYQQNGFTVER